MDALRGDMLNDIKQVGLAGVDCMILPDDESEELLEDVDNVEPSVAGAWRSPWPPARSLNIAAHTSVGG